MSCFQYSREIMIRETDGVSKPTNNFWQFTFSGTGTRLDVISYQFGRSKTLCQTASREKQRRVLLLDKAGRLSNNQPLNLNAQLSDDHLVFAFLQPSAKNKSFTLWGSLVLLYIATAIGKKYAPHPLNQSEANLKPNPAWQTAFSRAFGRLLIVTFSSLWLRRMLSFVL